MYFFKYLNIRTLFFAIIVLAFLAKIIALAALPDAAYTDGLYHLQVSKQIAASGSIPADAPLPLFHLIYANIIILTGLQILPPLTKLLPALLTLIYFLLSFLLLKRLFKEKWIFAFAFLAVSSYMLVFGSVNYVGPISAILVLFCLYIFLRLAESKSKTYLLLLSISLPLLAISKLNGTLLVPVFFIATIFFLWKNKYSKKTIALFSVAAILLSSFWFVMNAITVDVSSYADVSNLEKTQGTLGHVPDEYYNPAGALYLSYLSFWNFPPFENLQNLLFKAPLTSSIPLEIIIALFIIAMLPVSLCLIYGFYILLKKKELVSWTILGLIAANHIISITSLIHYGIIDSRYLIPTLPLYSVLFVYGLLNLNQEIIKKIVLISFFFLGIYSFSYVAYTSFYFAGVYEDHYSLYEFIRTLPEGENVVAISQGRQIHFFSERLQDPLICQNTIHLLKNFQQCLQENNINYVATSCYRESGIFLERVDEMLQENKLQRIFSDERECNTVYELR